MGVNQASLSYLLKDCKGWQEQENSFVRLALFNKENDFVRQSDAQWCERLANQLMINLLLDILHRKNKLIRCIYIINRFYNSRLKEYINFNTYTIVIYEAEDII